MNQKERLDVILVNRNLAASREKAKAVIMAGLVYVDGQKEDKAGTMIKPDAQIEVRDNSMKYVSRGGYKLEKAVNVFEINLTNLICLDAGSSTGGFTDCMLQNGAEKVYAVDVGTNQLAWSLRNDSRVISMEKTNLRYLTPDMIQDRIDFISIDVAFISLTMVMEPLKAVMKENARMVCLIKPQFEAGRENVGKKGVVREPAIHLAVVRKILGYSAELGFKILGLDYSPIRGPEGNIEYLLYLENSASSEDNISYYLNLAENIVSSANEKL